VDRYQHVNLVYKNGACTPGGFIWSTESKTNISDLYHLVYGLKLVVNWLRTFYKESLDRYRILPHDQGRGVMDAGNYICPCHEHYLIPVFSAISGLWLIDGELKLPHWSSWQLTTNDHSDIYRLWSSWTSLDPSEPCPTITCVFPISRAPGDGGYINVHSTIHWGNCFQPHHLRLEGPLLPATFWEIHVQYGEAAKSRYGLTYPPEQSMRMKSLHWWHLEFEGMSTLTTLHGIKENRFLAVFIPWGLRAATLRELHTFLTSWTV
jgi:hypothetical protein